MKNANMQSLVAKLRACPAHDASITREMFLEAWAELCREDVTAFIKPSKPVMAALLLSDDRFQVLLNKAEQEQLVSLVKLATERYEQKTNPPNKLGKLIIGRIKAT